MFSEKLMHSKCITFKMKLMTEYCKCAVNILKHTAYSLTAYSHQYMLLPTTVMKLVSVECLP
jgi:hypothetical protein